MSRPNHTSGARSTLHWLPPGTTKLTTSTTALSPGTVVRVRIRFTSGTGSKIRPALVLTGTEYHDSRRDAIVLPLTSNRAVFYPADYDLADWQSAGLPVASKVKCSPETIERSSIAGIFGQVSANDLARIREGLRAVPGL